jgi:hypothetical protein
MQQASSIRSMLLPEMFKTKYHLMNTTIEDQYKAANTSACVILQRSMRTWQSSIVNENSCIV